MPEGVGYGPQNTASVGLNLNIIGNHCYGYSGTISVRQATSPEIPFLDFRTGAYYIKANVIFGNQGGTSDDTRFTINVDEQVVTSIMVGLGTGVLPPAGWASGLKIIIPPLTRVTITGYDSTGASGKDWTCTLTGRVYGKVD